MATQQDGTTVGADLQLVAKISDPTHKQDRRGPMYEGREIHVSNVDWKANENDLKELFSKYGTVESARIPRKVDGSSKGFGYVVFSSKVGFSSFPFSNEVTVLTCDLRMRQMKHLPCMNKNSVLGPCKSTCRRLRVGSEVLQPLSLMWRTRGKLRPKPTARRVLRMRLMYLLASGRPERLA